MRAAGELIGIAVGLALLKLTVSVTCFGLSPAADRLVAHLGGAG